MRRILFLASALCAMCIAPSVTHAESQNLRTFESSISRTAPSTSIEATLRIEKIHIESPVYMGVTFAVFAKGVGQWPGTPRPGQRGNIVIGGHRTSGKKPFANIDKLERGDVISLTTRGITYRYFVTESLIVKPTDMWITDPTSNATLTLFACHPKGKTTQRYVVRASLVK